MSLALVNLLVVPGLGTAIAGRKSGYAQMALSVAGVLVTGAWLFSVLGQLMNEEFFSADLDLHLNRAILGLALFASGWLWSAASSWAVWKGAQDRPPLLK